MPEVRAHFEAQGKRKSEKELLELANALEPGQRGAPRFTDSPRFQDFINQYIFAAQKLKFFISEGATLLIDASQGDGGTVFVSGATVPQDLDRSSPLATLRSLFMASLNSYDKNAPQIVPRCC